MSGQMTLECWASYPTDERGLARLSKLWGEYGLFWCDTGDELDDGETDVIFGGRSEDMIRFMVEVMAIPEADAARELNPMTPEVSGALRRAYDRFPRRV